MPDTNYDFPVPTISGQAVTVQWLQADPRRIYRILNTLIQQRLIGHRLLAGRVDLTGSGSAVYEIAESIYADVASSVVAPLAEYPVTTTSPASLGLVKPLKDGLKTLISDEAIAHNRIDKVMRDLVKIANTLVTRADGLTLAAIASKVTQTQGVTSGAWTTAGANPFVDIGLAVAQIDTLNKGYSPGVVALNPTAFVYAISRAAVMNYLPRETADSVIATGNMTQIAGLTYWKTTNLPAGISGIVADATMLGATAWESLGGGYNGDPNPDSTTSGVESKRYRDDSTDSVVVQARLVRAPLVAEPGAAVLLPTAQIGA